MSDTFDAGWLALRETFDAASRSRALASRLIARLPTRPHLLDLGCGTGSLFRWLAPMIGGAQVWLLADADRALLDLAYATTAEWAHRKGWSVSFPQRAMLVHAPGGAWRVEALALDIADCDALPLDRADAVVTSALLDLVSADWMSWFAESLDVPFLACLTVDGRDAFLPAHPADAIVRAAFRRDQTRDKGFGRALGPRAASVALAALAAEGFALASAPSDWRISRGSLAMLEAMVEGVGEAAAAAQPARQGAIAAWRTARLRAALAMRLAIRIGHRDILAIPPEE